MNGFQKDEDWILGADDTVTVRIFAGAATATAIITGVVIGLTAYAVTEGVVSLVTGKSIGANIRDWAKSLLAEDSNSTKNSTETIPSISGAKNSSSYGKCYPFVMGKSLYTPYMLGIPKVPYYTTVSGEDGCEQYYHALYILGYNDIKARDFKLGTLKLASNNAGVEAGAITVDGSFGVSAYLPQLEIQSRDEVSIFNQKVIQENLNIELTNVINTDGIHDVNIPVRFSASCPQTVEVEFTYGGLVGYNTQGEEQNASSSIAVEYSKDGGVTWLPFGQIGVGQSNITYNAEGVALTYREGTQSKTTTFHGVSTITRKSNKQMRFVARREFSYGEVIGSNGENLLTNNCIEIRVVKINDTDPNTQNIEAVVISAIRTWCYDKSASVGKKRLVAQSPMIYKDRIRTTRVGLVLKSTDDLSGQIDAFNCIVSSKGRYCTVTVDDDGTKTYTWSGKHDVRETQNPASIALLALQSCMRGGYLDDDGEWHDGKWEYDDSKIDFDSFGEFYEWCEEKGYYDDAPLQSRFACNGVLTSQKKTSELINAILNVGRGCLVLKGKRYGVFIDKPCDEPVLILNNQNIISMSAEKTFETVPDGYSVKFVNEDNGFTTDESIVLDDYTEHSITEPDLELESVELPYETNWNQVWSNIRYKLACRKLRPETWTCVVATEGNLAEVGSLIEVQTDTLLVGIGEGAEIMGVETDGGYIKKIITDGNFLMEEGEVYAIKVMQADGYNAPKARTARVVNMGGYTNVFELDEGISLNEDVLPCIGDIVSFGIYDKVTTEAVCIGKSSDGEGNFTLTLLPYDENVYNADKTMEGIPEFDSKVTVPSDDNNGIVPVSPLMLMESQNAMAQEVSSVKAELKTDIAGISTNAVRVESSFNEVVFTLRTDGTANFQETEAELKLLVNEVLTAPSSVSVTGTTGVSVSGVLGDDNIYRLSISSTYGGVAPTGAVKVTFEWNGGKYVSTINVSSTSDCKYISGGLTYEQFSALTEIEIGNYFVYLGMEANLDDDHDNDVEDTSGFVVSQVYIAEQVEVEGLKAIVWNVDEDDDHIMTALTDICKCANIADDTKALLLVQRLVANSAFFNNLFSQKIEVGDLIEANYTPTNINDAKDTINDVGSGFKLDKDGVADINELTINGMRLHHDTNFNLCLGYKNFETVGDLKLFKNNVAIGFKALNICKNKDNVAIGKLALANCTGGNNVAIGSGAMSTGEGYFNIAIGSSTLLYSTTSSYNNIAIGFASLGIAQTSNNTAVGYGSLSQVSTGANNTGFGANAGNNITTGSSNICIGYNAKVDDPTASNQINIGNIIKYSTANGFTVNGTKLSTVKYNGTAKSSVNFAVSGNTLTVTFA